MSRVGGVWPGYGAGGRAGVACTAGQLVQGNQFPLMVLVARVYNIYYQRDSYTTNNERANERIRSYGGRSTVRLQIVSTATTLLYCKFGITLNSQI